MRSGVVRRLRRPRPGRGDLRTEQQRRGVQVDRVEEDEHRSQRAVDGAEAPGALQGQAEQQRDCEQQNSGHDRPGDGVAELEPPRRHEPVEEQDYADGEQERYAARDPLLDDATVDAKPVERALDPREHHLRREGHEDEGDDECSRADDQQHVDELAADGGTAALDPHRDLEAGAQRRHHPGRSPAEDEQAEQADSRRGTCQLLDLTGDLVAVAAAGAMHPVDDPVDHVVADGVVAKNETEDGNENDRERHEREEDAIGDSGRMLAASVGEEAVDCLGNDAEERAEQFRRPAQKAIQPRRCCSSGGGVDHLPSLGSSPGQQPASRVHFRPLPSPVAQLAEHSAVNRRVVGSSPTRGAFHRRGGSVSLPLTPCRAVPRMPTEDVCDASSAPRSLLRSRSCFQGLLRLRAVRALPPSRSRCARTASTRQRSTGSTGRSHAPGSRASSCVSVYPGPDVSVRSTRSRLGTLGRPLLGQRELGVGAVGWDVSSLEFRLIPFGLNPAAVDGRFTAATAKALALSKRSRGLTADGIAGKRTYHALARKRRAQRGRRSHRPCARRTSSSRARASSRSRSSTASAHFSSPRRAAWRCRR